MLKKLRHIFLPFCFILTILIQSSFAFALGDDECGDTDNKKARKLFEQALDALKSGKSQEAYKFFADATQEDPSFANAYVEMAYLNFRYSDDSEQRGMAQQSEQFYNKAVNNYKKAADACPSIKNYDICIWLAEYYFKKRDFETAKKYLQPFINNAKQHTDMAFAKGMMRKIDRYYELKANPVPYKPIKMSGVNTDMDEYLPMVSPDGDLFFYTHRYAKKSMDYGDFKWTDEFRVSKKAGQNNGISTYVQGNPMDDPFNKGIDQGAVSVTIDNNFMYVTLCEMSRTTSGPYKNCDIWVSEFQEGQWSTLKNLGPNVNGRTSWESQPSISADGKTLFFSTIRPGNIGFDADKNQTCDIWMSQMDENGVFQKAVNVGPVINTAGNEKSPYMHSDSQTLYFASDGHDGVGGYDIFYSKRKPGGTWETPKNIGYPINTENDEVGLIVSTQGKMAYFSSNTLNDNDNYDIYEFELPIEVRPAEVIFVKGQLKDDQGQELTEAKIKVENVQTHEVTEGMIDKMTGRYAVVIPVKKPDDEFLMTVKKRDYAFTSQIITAKETVKVEPVKIDFEVKPIEVDQTVQLNNIYFNSSSSELFKQSLFVLDNFLEFLEENPTLKIEIHGHTDNIGDAKNNQTLSEKRAKAVRDYLLLMGLDSSRIVAWKGYGQTKPIASNTTETGRAQNRRTEFVIVAK
ncbi:MAG: hypothetical protein CVU05_10655 [Bacteroidetes bacterium HGW-Bacteroidetes-21]|nr:MAG: hypothetical protein CVU05_10655 [Bacteroidetes bacterium HGW-Bacteroidetes-21]